MILQKLIDEKLIHPPDWLCNNTQFLCTMGSVAYGVSADRSDNDVYGFAIPPKDDVFPHLRGEIQGFGRQKHQFGQWQEHHIKDAGAEKSYDFAVYSIVKYFQLVMENNPNMVDSLFVDHTNVIHCTQIGQMVRERRKDFLHKGCWFKFKGYAYAQIHKIKTKNPTEGSKRHADIQAHGFDTKFAYHVVRLMLEVEQILVEHDLDLLRNREQLKAIRAGDWTEERLLQFFQDKEKALENAYQTSNLPHCPDEEAIKRLLMECLEHHYGSLDKVIPKQNAHWQALVDIYKISVKAIGQ